MKPTAKTARPTTRRFVPGFCQLETRENPATFYVDPLLSSANQVWNAGQPDQKTVVFGTNGFATLFAAFQAAATTSGVELDEIRLSQGLFKLTQSADPNSNVAPLNGSLVLQNNPVSIIGSGSGKSTIVPVASTANGTTGMLVADGDNGALNLSNLTVDGTGFNIGVGVLIQNGATGVVGTAGGILAAGATPSVVVQGINFPASSDGFAVSAFKAERLDVGASKISSFGRVGVSFDQSTGSVVGNTIVGNNGATTVNYGIQVFGGSTVTVTANTISNMKTTTSTGLASAAIAASAETGEAPSTVSVFRNTFQDSNVGLLVGATTTDQTRVDAGNNNYATLDVAIAADKTPANLTIRSQGDFLTGIATSTEGSAAFVQPVAAALPLTNTDSSGNPVPFTSLSQSQITAQPTLFNFIVGAGKGGSGQVQEYNGTGQTVGGQLAPLGALSGGVRVASADVNGDGIADQIVGSGPGGATRVIVVNGKDGTTLADFSPFEASFTGGVYVAAADINLDGKAEVFVTPDEGGGPRVKVYNGATVTGNNPAVLADFFGLADTSGAADSTFRGGARPGLGDITGDGVPDLILAAGFGGGPRMTVWNGTGIANANGGKPTSNPLANFFAFESTLRNGAFVSAGDFNGDGQSDLAFGGGPGGGPRVRIADGAKVLAAGNFGSLDQNLPLVISNFFAGDPNNRGGVRIVARDVTGDGTADLITGSGDGEASAVRIYSGPSILNVSSNPNPTSTASPFGGAVLAGGIYVG